MGASHQPRQPFNVNISYNCLDDCKRSQVGNTTIFPIHLIWCEVGVSKELTELMWGKWKWMSTKEADIFHRWTCVLLKPHGAAQQATSYFFFF